eukprot:CAMPEP_0180257044 /NCGR_PEP_ID=MMETSP0987-20121128/41616_1 /TAXON_ID=697907 /ORGANISM="non described non described, Strain CCMP2293" /LENGTH=166 /DNA_ID=CAMNT_0022226337 /DNA_START=300 /DNA_END=798 /DNA_ORIENTATION=-
MKRRETCPRYTDCSLLAALNGAAPSRQGALCARGTSSAGGLLASAAAGTARPDAPSGPGAQPGCAAPLRTRSPPSAARALRSPRGVRDARGTPPVASLRRRESCRWPAASFARGTCCARRAPGSTTAASSPRTHRAQAPDTFPPLSPAFSPSAPATHSAALSRRGG